MVMDSQFNTYCLFSQVSSEIDLKEDSADITRETDNGNVLGHGIGDSYNATENSIEIEFDDNVNIVYEFNDEGICTKIVYGVLFFSRLHQEKIHLILL